jgi:ribosomal protein S18 acetylase RimI-like enzyme
MKQHIRRAIGADIPRLMEIRGAVAENRLSDPGAVTAADYAAFIDHSDIWVLTEGDLVLGFAAGDSRDGSIWALFVAPGCEGRGIGRQLLPLACETLRKAGYATATLSTSAGTRADRFYRQNGWAAIGTNEKREVVFRKGI